jgi:hypothetical protein
MHVACMTRRWGWPALHNCPDVFSHGRRRCNPTSAEWLMQQSNLAAAGDPVLIVQIRKQVPSRSRYLSAAPVSLKSSHRIYIPRRAKTAQRDGSRYASLNSKPALSTRGDPADGRPHAGDGVAGFQPRPGRLGRRSTRRAGRAATLARVDLRRALPRLNTSGRNFHQLAAPAHRRRENGSAAGARTSPRATGATRRGEKER